MVAGVEVVVPPMRVQVGPAQVVELPKRQPMVQVPILFLLDPGVEEGIGRRVLPVEMEAVAYF